MREQLDLKVKEARGRHRTRQHGGAALEYILVSTFAAVVAVTALGFIGKVVKQQLVNMGEKLGISDTPDIADPFAGEQAGS